MPLPLILGPAVVGVAGLGSTIFGASKIKDAKETEVLAQKIHEENIYYFKSQHKAATVAVDLLGKKKLEILSSFDEFTSVFEKIHSKPQFKEYVHNNISIPLYNSKVIHDISLHASDLNITMFALGSSLFATGGSLLVTGILTNIIANKISFNADVSLAQAKRERNDVNIIGEYLKELTQTATVFDKALTTIYGIYQKQFNMLCHTVNVLQKRNWETFTESEKTVTQNTVLLVNILYQMGKVELVLKANDENSCNTVNTATVNKNISDSETILIANDLMTEKDSISASPKSTRKQTWELYDNTPEKEVLFIDYDEYIEEGIENKKIIANKEVHISGTITCEGPLVFVNCNIIYGSDDSLGEISVQRETDSDTDMLYFSNCTIIAEDTISYPFIQANPNSIIFIEHCTLHNLNHFIETDDAARIIISDSKFYNPSASCINGFVDRYGSITIVNCLFEVNTEPDNSDESIIEIHSWGDERISSVIDCTILQTNPNWHTRIFSIDRATFQNCNFENIYLCQATDTANIQNCKFDNCRYICSDSGTDITIKNSLFYNCGPIDQNGSFFTSPRHFDHSMIRLESGTIDSCKFYKCSGSLIKAQTNSVSYLGTEILNCDFVDLILPEQEDSISSLLNDGYGILCFSSNSGKQATVKNCNFNYIAANDSYIIATNLLDKQRERTVLIQDCNFNNCITLRKDQKLIQEKSYYYGLISSKEKWENTTSIANCSGLDDIVSSDTFSSPLPAELSDSLEQIWNNLQVGYDESKINS